MTASEIVARARAVGHTLRVDGDAITVHPEPKPKLASLLYQRQAEIVAFLRAEPDCPDGNACDRQHHRWRDGSVHHLAEGAVCCGYCHARLADCTCIVETVSVDDLMEYARRIIGALPGRPQPQGLALVEHRRADVGLVPLGDTPEMIYVIDAPIGTVKKPAAQVSTHVSREADLEDLRRLDERGARRKAPWSLPGLNDAPCAHCGAAKEHNQQTWCRSCLDPRLPSPEPVPDFQIIHHVDDERPHRRPHLELVVGGVDQKANVITFSAPWVPSVAYGLDDEHAYVVLRSCALAVGIRMGCCIACGVGWLDHGQPPLEDWRLVDDPNSVALLPHYQPAVEDEQGEVAS